MADAASIAARYPDRDSAARPLGGAAAGVLHGAQAPYR